LIIQESLWFWFSEADHLNALSLFLVIPAKERVKKFDGRPFPHHPVGFQPTGLFRGMLGQHHQADSKKTLRYGCVSF